MIDNWVYASGEDVKFIRKQGKWHRNFAVMVFFCVLPVTLLGIWQAYDIYVLYSQTFLNIGFIITTVILLVVALLTIMTMISQCRKSRRWRRGTIWKSQEGVVTDTRKEEKDKTVTFYYSFEYRDMCTGERKTHEEVDVSDEGKRMRTGDSLCVLACQEGDTFEIIDSFRTGEKDDALDASWIIADAVILAVMFAAYLFLYLDFGVASLYLFTCMNLSFLAVPVFTLIYGIIERRKGAIIAGVFLAGFFLVLGAPWHLKENCTDIVKGSEQVSGSIVLQKRTSTRRSRKGGRRKTTHYELNFSSETQLGTVEVTRDAYDYYLKQGTGRSIQGQILYYPDSCIFLYLSESN